MNRNMDDNTFNFAEDPRLDAMLDELLSADNVPGGIPAGLNDRILAATRAALAEPAPAVIGRVGYFASASFRRIAAAVVVMGGVVAAVIGTSIVREWNQQAEADRLAVERESLVQKQLAKLEIEVKQAPITVAAAKDTFAMASTAIDEGIDQLKDRANDADMAAAVENWNTVADSLEAELKAMDGASG